MLTLKMLEYQREHRLSGSAPPASAPAVIGQRVVQIPNASASAQAVGSGIARLKNLSRTLSQTSTVTPNSSLRSSALSPTEEELNAIDERVVDEAIRKYETEGLIPEHELERFDLLQYWQVSIFNTNSL